MNRSRTARSEYGGVLFIGLIVVMLAGIVAAFLILVEMPRRARIRSVDLIRTKFSGSVDTVSSCPAWLQETWAEDYFTHVVGVRFQLVEPATPEARRILAPFRELESCDIRLLPGTRGVIGSLPYCEDLVELTLVNPGEMPDPGRVPHLTDLKVIDPGWSPGDAEVLGRYENVERLDLVIRDPGVVIDALQAASRLPKLTELRLQDSNVPTEALAHLVRARTLLLLDLSQTGTTAAGIAHISRISTLQHLELDNNSTGLAFRYSQLRKTGSKRNVVDDASMSRIAKLPDLRFLQLDHTDVGDVGLAHLATIPYLQFLYLRATPVGNAGVREIAKLRYLQRLNLGKDWDAKAVIDDAAVDDLVQLTDLEALGLHYTDISTEGLQRLARELTRAEVGPWRGRSTPSRLKQKQIQSARVLSLPFFRHESPSP